MSEKTSSKPEKKGIARTVRKNSKTPKPIVTNKEPSVRKSSKNQLPNINEDDAEDDKQQEENDTTDKQAGKDVPEDKQRPKTRSRANPKPSASAPEDEDEGGKDEDTQYYDRAYVDAHKETEDFHHRGKGRWARGLPGPNATIRTAVMGPGAAAWKAAKEKDGGK